MQMLIERGRYIYADKKMMPREYLEKNPSVPGHMYELRIQFKNSIDRSQAERIARTLPGILLRKFRAKVKYMGIGSNGMVMQIEGSPFDWGELLLFLPDILFDAGVAVMAIAVMLIIRNDIWEALILLAGAIMAYEGWKMKVGEEHAARFVESTVRKVIR